MARRAASVASSASRAASAGGQLREPGGLWVAGCGLRLCTQFPAIVNTITPHHTITTTIITINHVCRPDCDDEHMLNVLIFPTTQLDPIVPVEGVGSNAGPATNLRARPGRPPLWRCRIAVGVGCRVKVIRGRTKPRQL